MEFGMFHEFQRRAGANRGRSLHRIVRAGGRRRTLGLDVMWLAELHTAPERSVLAAPLTIATAIAARTKRMKIGIAVQVLPLCHPLQLAEEAATVDQISHGRLIFGVGRSGFPRTYQAYGVSYAESRERFAEVLEILKRAWTQETFQFHGKFYDFDNVYLVPKPYQTAVSGDPRRGEQPRHLSGTTARRASRSSSPRASAICTNWCRT